MDERQYTMTQVGGLMGLVIGGGLASVMFAITGEPWYFGLVGGGLALGVGIGSSLEERRSGGDDD
jgi:hypothetical protein